jgi:bifunctional non-homologous end joining protein LigD
MVKRSRSPTPIDVSALKGVREVPFPGFVPLCHPTLRTKLPEGGDWLYEAKLDGYRAQLHRHDGKAVAYTRNGLDWTDAFAPLCAALAEVPARSMVLDGEVVVPGADGVPDFGAVRGAIASAPERLAYYAFDLLHLDGFDLRGARLDERRRVLAQLVAGKPGGRILMSETIDSSAAELLRSACAMGLEGVVAKRASAPYRGERSENWIKVRCMKSERLAVIGYVPASGNSIAALRLGRCQGNELIYVGKAGTGFTERSAQSVRERLQPLIRRTPPVPKLRKRDTVWVEPKLTAKIEFRGMTEDGMLRHPSFKGLE